VSVRTREGDTEGGAGVHDGVCRQFTSDEDGIVHQRIQPVTHKVTGDELAGVMDVARLARPLVVVVPLRVRHGSGNLSVERRTTGSTAGSGRWLGLFMLRLFPLWRHQRATGLGCSYGRRCAGRASDPKAQQ